MTRIKAAVAHAFGQPLSIEEVELAHPKSGEVEVTLDACAICHSDITYLDGGFDTGHFSSITLMRRG